MRVHPPFSHGPRHRVGSDPLEQPNGQSEGEQPGLMSDHQRSPAKPLLWFIPVSIQMVSVLGRIATVVHVAWLPRLDPPLHQASVGISLIPSLQAAGLLLQERRALEVLHTPQGQVAPALPETAGWWTGSKWKCHIVNVGPEPRQRWLRRHMPAQP